MSEKPPGDKPDATVEPTLDDLRAVDTNPVLKPVPQATITLDEEPVAAPGVTQLLDPVEDAPTDPKVRVPTSLATPLVLGESRDTTPRKRASIKSDAFESSPSLGLPRREGLEPARAPASPQSRWTPGLIVLTIILVFILLVGLFVLMTSLA